MKIQTSKTDLIFSQRARRTALAASASLLCITGLLGAGCSKKDPTTSAATSGVAKGPSDVSPGMKPTPEQEAAKQQAIQQGPAIEAALRDQQTHK